MDKQQSVVMEEYTSPASPGIPHSREAEEAVLGSVIIYPDVFHECRLELPDGGEEFYIHRNRWIWQAFEALILEEKPIDLLLLSEELQRQGTLAEIGGSAYLTSLINQVPTSLNAKAYAVVVHDLYVRRKMITAANEIASLAYRSESLDEITASATKAVSDAVSLNAPKFTISLADSVDFVDSMIASNLKLGVIPGIPTPWVDLNKMLGGGSQNSDLYMVLGRPGDGKTSALMQIALHAGRYTIEQRIIKKRVVIFSCEMPHEQLTLRLIAQIAGIDYQLLRSGLFDDVLAYEQARDYLKSLDIVIDGKPGATPSYIQSRLEQINAQKRVDLVCVDSLNLMRSGLKIEKKYMEVDHNATQLKTIAREFNLPVWTSHQMNRGKEQRGSNSTPELSDARDGGEQPTDMMMFIDHERSDDKTITKSKFVIAKHRNGPVGEIPIFFEQVRTRFMNATKFSPNKSY